MYSYENLKSLHVELSTKCNVRCPNCPRNDQGGKTLSWIEPREISLAKFKEYFPPELLTRVESIIFCGSFGDPGLCKDLLEIVEYTNSFGIALKINTNGSNRDANFWRKLSDLVNENSFVVFSIDGLEDTNHIYRQGARWNKLWKNVEAFHQGSGRSVWELLVFEHNQHQIPEIKRLAKEVGFEKVLLKEPFGFLKRKFGFGRSRMPVANLKGEISHYLYPPKKDISQESAPRPPSSKTSPSKTNKNLTYKYEIVCRGKVEREAYVDVSGNVFPCCFFPAMLPLEGDFGESSRQLMDFMKNFSTEENSLEHRSLQEIVEGEYLKKIEASWQLKSHADGKLRICSEFCDRRTGCYEELYNEPGN